MIINFAAEAAPTTVEPRPPTDAAIPSLGGHFALKSSAGREVTEASFPGKWLLVIFRLYGLSRRMSDRTQRGCYGARRSRAPRRQGPADLRHARSEARHASAPVRLRQGVRPAHPWALRYGRADRRQPPRHFMCITAARPLGNSEYAIDHSAYIYVVNPHGQVVAIADRQFARSSDGGRVAAPVNEPAARLGLGLLLSGDVVTDAVVRDHLRFRRRQKASSILPMPTIGRQVIARQENLSRRAARPVMGGNCKVSHCGRSSINSPAEGPQRMTRPAIPGCMPTKKSFT